MFNRAAQTFILFATVVLATASAAAPFSVLYDFGQNPNDPINPGYSGILAQGRDGNLYGTVAFGGAFQVGAMIKVTRTGQLTVVYSFDGKVGFAPFG